MFVSSSVALFTKKYSKKWPNCANIQCFDSIDRNQSCSPRLTRDICPPLSCYLTPTAIKSYVCTIFELPMDDWTKGQSGRESRQIPPPPLPHLAEGGGGAPCPNPHQTLTIFQSRALIFPLSCPSGLVPHNPKCDSPGR